MIRSLYLAAVAALIACGCASPHDDRLMECNDNDLATKPFGCELLGTKRVDIFPTASVFWHISRFPSRSAADAAAHGPADFVVSTENQVWLYSFGPKEEAAATGGTALGVVGPLSLTAAHAYQITAYRGVMPPHAHTDVHRHPGPEAWYLLSGHQCLETPDGVTKATAGETAMVRPEIAMQLTNDSDAVRRALFIIIHDAAQPDGYLVDTWKPKGLCDRPGA